MLGNINHVTGDRWPPDTWRRRTHSCASEEAVVHHTGSASLAERPRQKTTSSYIGGER